MDIYDHKNSYVPTVSISNLISSTQDMMSSISVLNFLPRKERLGTLFPILTEQAQHSLYPSSPKWRESLAVKCHINLHSHYYEKIKDGRVKQKPIEGTFKDREMSVKPYACLWQEVIDFIRIQNYAYIRLLALKDNLTKYIKS